MVEGEIGSKHSYHAQWALWAEQFLIIICTASDFHFGDTKMFVLILFYSFLFLSFTHSLTNTQWICTNTFDDFSLKEYLIIWSLRIEKKRIKMCAILSTFTNVQRTKWISRMSCRQWPLSLIFTYNKINRRLDYFEFCFLSTI